MGSPEFWSAPDKGQERLALLKRLQEPTRPIESLLKSFEDLKAFQEILSAEQDAEMADEFQKELARFRKELGRLELRVMLSGKEDSSNCYLSIHAGAGGTESCDWAQMLLRMYTRWIERRGYRSEIVDMTPGEQAGIRSVALHIIGKWAYGFLKAETGVHRLVRISPFDANRRRHTSFASVDVVPEVEETEIELKENDVEIQFFRRASGPGGQNVNKVATAVRVKHVPTGVVVECVSERSQHSNRETALKILKSKLYKLRETERQKEMAKIYSEKGEIAWGNQIRSYVLQPYQMVKDHRTKLETSNVESVLNGEITPFIEAYLKSKIRQGKGS